MEIWKDIPGKIYIINIDNISRTHIDHKKVNLVRLHKG